MFDHWVESCAISWLVSVFFRVWNVWHRANERLSELYESIPYYLFCTTPYPIKCLSHSFILNFVSFFVFILISMNKWLHLFAHCPKYLLYLPISIRKSFLISTGFIAKNAKLKTKNTNADNCISNWTHQWHMDNNKKCVVSFYLSSSPEM